MMNYFIKIITFFFILFILSCTNKPVEIVMQKYPDGKTRMTYFLTEGTQQNPISCHVTNYYENKIKMMEGEIVDHKAQNKWTYYYESGKISRTMMFVDAKRNGPFYEYYESGELAAKGEAEDDSLKNAIFYYHNGKEIPCKINYADFLKPVVTPWTTAQQTAVKNKLRQNLQYDRDMPSPILYKLLDSIIVHLPYATYDTLSEYERQRIIGIFFDQYKLNAASHRQDPVK